MADSSAAEETQGTSSLRPRFGWLSDRALATLFSAPTMVLLLAIAIFPLIWSLYLSFTKFSVIKDADTGPVWIGLANYGRLLLDEDVWARFGTTARFVISAVGIEFLIGFGLALLLNRNFKGRGLIMTLMLVPPLLLIALLFRAIDAYKMFDQAYALTGGGPNHTTEVLSIYLYQMAFRDFNTGKGSALGYIMLIVIIALANLLIRVLNQLKADSR